MAAQTNSQQRSIRVIKRAKRPLSAGAVVFKGGLAAIAADGFYIAATGATTEVVDGLINEDKDNTAGADGALSVEVDFLRERIVVLRANDGVAPVVVADRGRPCYVLDDATVTGDDTQCFAGIVYDVTSEGVWVEICQRGPQGEPGA